ncbi:host-nuclease inhibitor Gam family protein [Oceanobacillus sp. FSL H7-0719]|uniref:host-nuclease inhibitor Gam family protein n=1 Tax=Oceanobacillus sp. FSL H7-0719 TaxID=2954507 RepID=UPI00324E5208
MTEEQVVDNVEEKIDVENIEQWKIDSMIQEVKDNNEEIKKLESILKNRISELEHQFNIKKDRLAKQNYFLTTTLGEYAKTQKLKKAKTQSTYSSLTGNVVIKHSAKSITKPAKENEGRLAELYPEYTSKEEVIKVDWKEIKKNLVMQGDSVYDKNTGEVLDDIVEIAEKEEEIIIK